ncbi:hypothetical protein PQR02_39815 [Paraburkholderia sediminicola]
MGQAQVLFPGARECAAPTVNETVLVAAYTSGPAVIHVNVLADKYA